MTDKRQDFLDMMGIYDAEDVCKTCGGRGHRVYGSTATWRGGIGGQMMTTDVCDKCWGTGRSDKKGVDLRVLFRKYEALEAQAQRDSEALRHHQARRICAEPGCEKTAYTPKPYPNCMDHS